VPVIGGKTVPLGVDGVIGGLVERQHGVVCRGQLVAAGVGVRAIEYRVEAGRLHPLHRGVFAVGHRAVSQRARWLAAVLASGIGAVLSHRAAAALWGIRPASGGRIEVTKPRTRDERKGLLLHRAVLPNDEVTTHEGIPTTTPARTLLDLAAVLDRHQLQRAMNEAEVRRLEGPFELVQRYPRRKGIAKLRTLAPPTHTRSDLEARFATFLDDRGFPPPLTNPLIEEFEVDAAWPDRRLIVELDSYEFHRTRQAFENDRRRDRRLTAAGWRVMRVTWRDLDEPGRLAAELAGL
jgi:hypothetical protein